MKIYNSISELIGNTPLFSLERFVREKDLRATILGKLEFLNPSGSIKDRAARGMLEDALSRGVLKHGGVIIEPTSGNTGIRLAAIAVPLGFRVILTMPETMSSERRALLRNYGAELVLTPGALGMNGAIEKAKQLANEIQDSFIPSQFTNPANAAAHEATTGPEIWSDTDGTVDILVCGVGSGGTITGAGRYLRGKKPDIRIVAVEPASSPVLSGGAAGLHGLQGIGAGFVPEVLDESIIDEIIAVRDEDAYESARELSRLEGLLAGITSGAALRAAAMLAEQPENEGKTIVVIFPDTGERYLSTPLF
ncbi:MAG: cysteine synthase A [Clostridiales bacterium]|nr:cysteine synthase A [Clostridiales bacterium]